MLRKLSVQLFIAAVLVVGICTPGIKTILVWTWIVKKGPGRIQADFPSGWRRIDVGSLVTAVNPCWTIFCSSPRSTLVVRFPKRFILSDTGWRKRAKKDFADGQLGSAVARSFPSSLGQVECLEARLGTNLAEARCYAASSGLSADFSGTAGDLEKFYHTVASVNVPSPGELPRIPLPSTAR
jgi:hypothetical protein